MRNSSLRSTHRATRGLWLAVLLSACATPTAPEVRPRAVDLPPPPDITPRSLSRPDSAPRSAMLRLLETTRFTIDVQDADLPAVLLGLGRKSPLNVVVDPAVKGRVTADLRDVSLLEILDEIVVARGFRYAVQGKVLRIYRTERETRTYRVDYPSYSRNGTGELSLTGFIGEKPDIGTDSSSGETGATDTSLSTVITTQSSDIWGEIERAIRSIVFGSPDGAGDPAKAGADSESGLPPRRVFVGREIGVISVTAETRVLEEVERYLANVDRSLERQVLIDAEIIEITLGDDLDLGLDIEAAPDIPGVAGIFSRLITPGLREATIVQALAPTLTEGGFSFGLADDDIGVTLRALARQTDVRVVSTPRIATLSNHKALIKVVRNEVFFIANVETTITDQVVQQVTEFQPRIVPVGVTLDVTPHVSDSSEITLHIRPSVSEIVSIESQPTSDPNLPQTGSLPVVDLRETDSVLRVADGTTIVIGGLVQSREFEQERSVPFLGDIPYLGNLFKQTNTEERRTELVIFLTPTILDPPRVVRTSEQAESALGEIDSMRASRSAGWPWWRQSVGESLGRRP